MTVAEAPAPIAVHRRLGLTDAELEAINERLGRAPNRSQPGGLEEVTKRRELHDFGAISLQQPPTRDVSAAHSPQKLTLSVA